MILRHFLEYPTMSTVGYVDAMKKRKLTIQFLGAAGTVTGSRFLVRTGDYQVLVDCGLFQGQKSLRLRNWERLEVDAASINAVLLSHAHLDHSGYLPALVEQGFTGPIYSTSASFDLCKILLRDAGKLQEEDANYHNRHGTSKHDPAIPLFTIEQAERALNQFTTVPFGKVYEAGPFKATFHPNGHILGSASIDLQIGGKHLLFSGDLGRPGDEIMKPPVAPGYCDYLFIESTYGDRLHAELDAADTIADLICETAHRGGSVLIPAFAVGRSQVILHHLTRLRDSQRIPQMPIYVDSPMSISATQFMLKYHDLVRPGREQLEAICRSVHFTNTVEQSKGIGLVRTPKLIISASGMATGGRVLHHLKAMLGDHRNTIMFVGFQAQGTRGDRLTKGERQIKIHGHMYQVDAQIAYLDFLSAHADYSEVIHWLMGINVAPKQCFVIHGEQAASAALKDKIHEQLGWNVVTPSMGDIIEL